MGGPLLLVAGGSGICPLMAMIRHRVARGSGVPTRLLYSSRSLEDVIYRDEIDRLAALGDGLELFHTLTRSRPHDWNGYAKRIDRDMLAEVTFSPEQHPLSMRTDSTGRGGSYDVGRTGPSAGSRQDGKVRAHWRVATRTSVTMSATVRRTSTCCPATCPGQPGTARTSVLARAVSSIRRVSRPRRQVSRRCTAARATGHRTCSIRRSPRSRACPGQSAAVLAATWRSSRSRRGAPAPAAGA